METNTIHLNTYLIHKAVNVSGHWFDFAFFIRLYVYKKRKGLVF